MKAKDHLYFLIHSLTRMEKRYFKMSSNLQAQGVEKHYVLLFDILDAMPAYDQEALRLALEKEGIGGNISTLKAYLYKLILRVMRAFHAERSAANRLREALMDAEFLIQKGLYAQAKATLDKAKAEAEAHGRPLVEIELLGIEAHAALLQAYQRLPEQIDGILAARSAVIARFDTEAALQSTFLRLLARHRKHGNLRGEPQQSEVLAIIAELPEDIDAAPLSAHARTYLTYIRVLEQECIGDAHAILAASTQHVAAWEADPLLAKEYPTNYRRALANHLAALFKADQFAAFPEVLARLKALPPLHHDDEAEIFQNAAFYELLYHLNRAKLAEAASLVPVIERGLVTYQGRLNKSREISFCFNVCLLYFFSEAWSNALRWLNRLVNDQPSELRLDVQQVLRIFELILHVELGNWDLLESKLRAATRHYRLYHPTDTLLSALVDFFAHLVRKGELGAMHEEMAALYDQIANLPEGDRPPGALELMLWLRARISGRKLQEILHEYTATRP